MASILSNSGISSGSMVETTHITQIVDAFTKTQAYDITLSGSLTVTGSVILDTIIDQDFYGTASFVTTSSYSPSASNVSYAYTTSFANNDTTFLELYHPINTFNSASTFYFADGEPAIGSPEGIGTILPFNGLIVSASATSIVNGSTGTYQSTISLISGSTAIKIGDLVYSAKNQTVRDSINLPFTSGSRIYCRIVTENGTTPTNVIHNVILYIKYNG
jgi:hypothetical protein